MKTLISSKTKKFRCFTKTHRRTATLMQSPKLLLCTAKSIKATTSLFNASTVALRRVWQSISGLCISDARVLAHSLHVWGWTDFPIAQTSHLHWCGTSKALWIVSLQHQLYNHPGFRDPPDLFGHYAGIGHTWWIPQWQGLEIDTLKTIMNVHDDIRYIPFWSGQRPLKNLRSSSGRWLSIGTQYLKVRSSALEFVDLKSTNHMACNLDCNFLSSAFCRIKSRTISSSLIPPDSNPRESWKM